MDHAKQRSFFRRGGSHSGGNCCFVHFSSPHKSYWGIVFVPELILRDTGMAEKYDKNTKHNSYFLSNNHFEVGWRKFIIKQPLILSFVSPAD